MLTVRTPLVLLGLLLAPVLCAAGSDWGGYEIDNDEDHSRRDRHDDDSFDTDPSLSPEVMAAIVIGPSFLLLMMILLPVLLWKHNKRGLTKARVGDVNPVIEKWLKEGPVTEAHGNPLMVRLQQTMDFFASQRRGVDSEHQPMNIATGHNGVDDADENVEWHGIPLDASNHHPSNPPSADYYQFSAASALPTAPPPAPTHPNTSHHATAPPPSYEEATTGVISVSRTQYSTTLV